MMKTKPIWIVFIFLLAFALVQGFQRAEASVVGADTSSVTATASGGVAGPEVNAYDTVPGDPLTVAFGAIDAATSDYHLALDANLAWAALPGSWELLVYYDAGYEVKGTGPENLGAPLSVAIGFELDDAAAAANPPTDLTFGDLDGTYRIIRLGSVLKHVLADGTSVVPPGEPNEGERKFEDFGERPFVLAVSTKNGRVFNGTYAGTLTFDLDNGL